jgi:hypothetical protein
MDIDCYPFYFFNNIDSDEWTLIVFFFLLVKQVDGSSIIFIIILAPLDLYSFRASFSINKA